MFYNQKPKRQGLEKAAKSAPQRDWLKTLSAEVSGYELCMMSETFHSLATVIVDHTKTQTSHSE